MNPEDEIKPWVDATEEEKSRGGAFGTTYDKDGRMTGFVIITSLPIKSEQAAKENEGVEDGS